MLTKLSRKTWDRPVVAKFRIPKTKVSSKKIFFVLFVFVLFLGGLNVAKAKGWLLPEQPPVTVVDHTISLSSLTLEQKIAQMIVVHGSSYNLAVWKKMQLGGIHLFAMENESLFRKTIQEYQQGGAIPFLVTVDLEGCWNPFANFKEFVPASEIKTLGNAFEKGYTEGRYLHQLGFTINFAPVVDLKDQIWLCRTFPGNATQIAELAQAYVLGLQSQGVLATAKHYPGKTLTVKDPHKYQVAALIGQEDLYPYSFLTRKSLNQEPVRAVMISHIIASGEVNSSGLPASSSEAAVSSLKKRFSGLIVTDEINMQGLKSFYSSPEEMYLAVFLAGNDLILDFSEDPNEIYHLIRVVKRAVEKSKISETMIDASVKKILEAKGFKVVE